MTQVDRRAAAMATFAGNGLTVAITVAQAFFLIPVCLASLGPGLYARWLAASEVLIWLQMLDGGLPNLLMQRVGALVGRSEWEQAARWSSTVLAGLLAISTVLCGAAIGLAPVVVDWLGGGGPDRETFIACFRVGALASVGLMLANGCVGLARGVQQTGIINVSQVTGAAAGLVVSLALLLAGWGLWALAIGLSARALVAVVGALWFLLRLPATPTGWVSAPSRVVARDVGQLLPYMATSSVAYVLATNSEVLLVTSILGPLPALAYALTRRAFDGVKALLDTIAWAVTGGFAHLVTAGDRSRSRAVLREILWMRFGVASVGVAIVVAVNDAFVSLLFGPGQYAGFALTITFALQIMLTGQSFLMNYLWRATGKVREGSTVLGGEALVRVGAMMGGLKLIGLTGAPLAASLVSAGALAIVHRRLQATLPEGPDDPVPPRVVWTPVVVLAVAAVAGVVPAPTSWTMVVATIGSVGAIGAALLWWSLPVARRAVPWRRGGH